MQRWCELGFLLVWGWLCMTFLHEAGHIAVGCAAGGELQHFELRPWCLPYSLFATNPAPLLTLWAGPLLGCIVMLAIAAVTRQTQVWLVAWFCVVANGLYLLVGYYAGDAELDSTKLLKAGTPVWVLLCVGTAMTVAGYAGFRQECQRVLGSKEHALTRRGWIISTGAMIALILFLAAVGSR